MDFEQVDQGERLRFYAYNPPPARKLSPSPGGELSLWKSGISIHRPGNVLDAVLVMLMSGMILPSIHKALGPAPRATKIGHGGTHQ